MSLSSKESLGKEPTYDFVKQLDEIGKTLKKPYSRTITVILPDNLSAFILCLVEKTGKTKSQILRELLAWGMLHPPITVKEAPK